MPASHDSRRSAISTPPAESKEQGKSANDVFDDRGYRHEYASIARKMCKLGAAVTDLAEAFDVNQATIKLWQVTHEEFFEACRLSDENADERLEQSSYQRAVGYDYDAEKVVRHKGKSVIFKYRVHVPGDANAQQFRLINRRPNRWQKPSNIEPALNNESPLMELAKMLSGTGKRPRE